MQESEFLTQVGWPQDHLDKVGVLTWTAPSEDQMENVVASIARADRHMILETYVASLEGKESLMLLEAQIGISKRVNFKKSTAGEPPEEIEAETALQLFTHLSSGMGKPSFSPSGLTLDALRKQKEVSVEVSQPKSASKGI